MPTPSNKSSMTITLHAKSIILTSYYSYYQLVHSNHLYYPKMGLITIIIASKTHHHFLLLLYLSSITSFISPMMHALLSSTSTIIYSHLNYHSSPYYYYHPSSSYHPQFSSYYPQFSSCYSFYLPSTPSPSHLLLFLVTALLTNPLEYNSSHNKSHSHPKTIDNTPLTLSSPHDQSPAQMTTMTSPY